ncbi:hypothetical protein NL676_023789 [Syzygium grande]|nr:hypothetical protein NL676_023789 [Syzygium grande]
MPVTLTLTSSGRRGTETSLHRGGAHARNESVGLGDTVGPAMRLFRSRGSLVSARRQVKVLASNYSVHRRLVAFRAELKRKRQLSPLERQLGPMSVIDVTSTETRRSVLASETVIIYAD